MLILVTGAGGRTGRTAIRALAARGVDVRALVRRQEQAAAVRNVGAAEVMVGDLRDKAVLRRAVQGTAGTYYIAPPMHPDEVSIGERLIAAQRDAGAGRFVYHSVLHPHIDDLPHHLMKLRVERLVIDCGLAYTILQPGRYMQDLLPHRYEVGMHGVYREPYSVLAPFSWIALQDVAEVAARVIAEPGHDSATYELAGPEPLNSAQVAERWEQALGRSVRSETVPAGDWAASLSRSGIGGYTLEAIGCMVAYYHRHGLVGNSNALAWLLGRPPTRLADFLRTAVRELEVPGRRT
jgi:NAD(P)H dehydrogenase (quinone)